MEGIDRLKRYVRFSGLVIVLLLLVLILENCIPPTPPPVSMRFLLNDQDHPLRNKDVRVLCYASDSLKSFLAKESTTVTTDMEGRATLTSKCAFLAALYQFYEPGPWNSEPDETDRRGPAYKAYYISWDSHSTNKLTPATDNVVVFKTKEADWRWKLIVFNVFVSTEWEADSAYVNKDLKETFSKLSKNLYNRTQGQMAIGPVNVYTNGVMWEKADTVIHVSNNQPPNAKVGGIVASDTRIAIKTGGEAIFSPGKVTLGRYWNGNDASSGHWYSDDAVLTLEHEKWHQFFLFDEYLHWPQTITETFLPSFATDNLTPSPKNIAMASLPSTVAVTATPTPDWKYCTCNELPSGGCSASMMAYQYKATKLWHTGDVEDPPGVCTQSLQGVVHGESDWDTLHRWGDIQDMRALNLKIPPSFERDLDLDLDPAKNLFEFSVTRSPVPPGSNRRITIEIPGEITDSNLPVSHVYLLKGGEISPNRILYQGGAPVIRSLPYLDKMEIWDVTDDDTAWISVDRYTASGLDGARYFYKGPITDGQAVEVVEDKSNASLDFVYRVTDTGKFTELTVVLTDPDELLGNKGSATAQLCFPDAELGCMRTSGDPRIINLTDPDRDNIWTGTFKVNNDLPPGTDEFPPYGEVLVNGFGVNKEVPIVRLADWIKNLRTAGPAHMGGDAPVVDGHLMVNVFDTTEESTISKSDGTVPVSLEAEAGGAPDISLQWQCNRIFIALAIDYNARNTSINTADTPTDRVEELVGQVVFDIDSVNLEQCDNPYPPNFPRSIDRPLPTSTILKISFPKSQFEPIQGAGRVPTLQMASLQPGLAQTGAIQVPASELRIIHFDRESCLADIDECKWELLDKYDQDQNLGWVAAEIGEDGIYAIARVTTTAP